MRWPADFKRISGYEFPPSAYPLPHPLVSFAGAVITLRCNVGGFPLKSSWQGLTAEFAETAENCGKTNGNSPKDENQYRKIYLAPQRQHECCGTALSFIFISGHEGKKAQQRKLPAAGAHPGRGHFDICPVETRQRGQDIIQPSFQASATQLLTAPHFRHKRQTTWSKPHENRCCC